MLNRLAKLTLAASVLATASPEHKAHANGPRDAVRAACMALVQSDEPGTESKKHSEMFAGQLSAVDWKKVRSLLDAYMDLAKKNEQVKGDNQENARVLAMKKIAAAVAMVEQQMPVLKSDVPGWEGNMVFEGKYADPEKAPQFTCLERAKQAMDILELLQKQGILDAGLEFSPKHLSAFKRDQVVFHQAVSITEKGKADKLILDTWLGQAGTPAKIYAPSAAKSAEEQWEDDCVDQSKSLKDELKKFKLSLHVKENGGRQAASLLAPEDEYMMLKHVLTPGGQLRESVHPNRLLWWREHLAHFFPRAEKEILATRKIEELDAHSRAFFSQHYPEHPLVKAWLHQKAK